MAVGLSPFQARRSGTHYRPSFVVCPSVLATLDGRLSRAILYCTQRNEDALHNIALYKFLILFYSNGFSALRHWRQVVIAHLVECCFCWSLVR